MASEDSNKLQLCDLPFELLCLVLELVEVRELFPCFLVSSWFRQAADHDLCWKSRYQRDFSVSASLEDRAAASSSPSWKEACRFNAELCWDTTECTALPLEHHSGGNAKVTLENAFSENNRVVRWEGRYGYLSVRAKQCFKKEGASGGVFACEFLVRHFNDAHSSCLGVVDDSWDCLTGTYRPGREKHSFMWWTNFRIGQDVCGGTQELQIGRHLSCAWQTGDTVGVLVNFKDRAEEDPLLGHTIHFFLNGEQESMAFPDSIHQLWPCVNLFAHGDIIEIKGCHKEKYSNGARWRTSSRGIASCTLPKVGRNNIREATIPPSTSLATRSSFTFKSIKQR
ncbi:hypothetical protein QOT17_020861 [Balamuthia mandrillaris]